MLRKLLALALVVAVSDTVRAADPPKDTAAAAFTRNKKLKGKITVEIKDLPLKDAIGEISGQLEDKKLGTLSVHYGIGISGNTKVSFSGKEVTAEDALDAIFKKLDLGYHVVSKEKDRYDGWIEVNRGTHRGYPPGVQAPMSTGTTPTPVTKPEEPKKPEDPKTPIDPKTANDPDEKNAALRLEEAKKLLAEMKADSAKPLLKYIVRFFPSTKAAGEAKELLEKNK
jgi:hypothetical protein